MDEKKQLKKEKIKLRIENKLEHTLDEFVSRVGKQAVVLLADPNTPDSNFKVLGAKPLNNVIQNLKEIIMEELQNTMANQEPTEDDQKFFDLPQIKIDGNPISLNKMTQSQLRSFIPAMLKYTTRSGRVGWGNEDKRPLWWPKEVPWKNVKTDLRSNAEKNKLTWTDALKLVITSCYKYHGREDLLLMDEEKKETADANLDSQCVIYKITKEMGVFKIVQEHSECPIITLPNGSRIHLYNEQIEEEDYVEIPISAIPIDILAKNETDDMHTSTSQNLMVFECSNDDLFLDDANRNQKLINDKE